MASSPASAPSPSGGLAPSSKDGKCLLRLYNCVMIIQLVICHYGIHYTPVTHQTVFIASCSCQRKLTAAAQWLECSPREREVVGLYQRHYKNGTRCFLA